MHRGPADLQKLGQKHRSHSWAGYPSHQVMKILISSSCHPCKCVYFHRLSVLLFSQCCLPPDTSKISCSKSLLLFNCSSEPFSFKKYPQLTSYRVTISFHRHCLILRGSCRRVAPGRRHWAAPVPVTPTVSRTQSPLLMCMSRYNKSISDCVVIYNLLYINTKHKGYGRCM